MKASTNIEQLHQQFISSLKKEKRWVRFYQLIIFLVFFQWMGISQSAAMD